MRCERFTSGGACYDSTLNDRIAAATDRGFRFLAQTQRVDGSWVPLWFGNQDVADEENPVYGTAKVLLAYRDLQQLETNSAQRGLEWLRQSQNEDGGWGGGASVESRLGAGCVSSVEETAVAVEALAAASDPASQQLLTQGVRWLVEAVEGDRHLTTSPIGFYFAKLWYHEKLYPLIFTVSALGRALDLPERTERAATAHLTC